MNDNDFIRNEWVPTAQRLAADGFHVLTPDFHSGPEQLRPGRATGDDMRSLLVDLAMHQNNFVPARYRSVIAPKMVVLGKSWGAKMAAEAGTLEQVVGTVLTVPAFGEDYAKSTFPAIGGKVAVLMVKDDNVAPVRNGPIFKQLLADRGTYFEAKTGGHRVVPEFVEPIARFMAGVREDFSHSHDDEAAPEL